MSDMEFKVGDLVVIKYIKGIKGAKYKSLSGSVGRIVFINPTNGGYSTGTYYPILVSYVNRKTNIRQKFYFAVIELEKLLNFDEKLLHLLYGEIT